MYLSLLDRGEKCELWEVRKKWFSHADIFAFYNKWLSRIKLAVSILRIHSIPTWCIDKQNSAVAPCYADEQGGACSRVDCSLPRDAYQIRNASTNHNCQGCKMHRLRHSKCTCSVVFSQTTTRLSKGTKHRCVAGVSVRRLCLGVRGTCTGAAVSSGILWADTLTEFRKVVDYQKQLIYRWREI